MDIIVLVEIKLTTVYRSNLLGEYSLFLLVGSSVKEGRFQCCRKDVEKKKNRLDVCVCLFAKKQ